MELYLQFGYGMMEHCRQLLGRWGGGTVVLSPRDMTPDQLARLAADIVAIPNSNVLLDPQFYVPHSDHERLRSHEYWPANYETSTFWEGPALTRLLTTLQRLNRSLGSSAFILPGLLAQSVCGDWLETQRAILEEASSIEADTPLVATIALGADAARDQNQIALLLECLERESRRPSAYYIVCEHPNGKYLVDDPNWLANVVDLAAGLRFLGAEVILGYCNHQMLIAATAKVKAMCSGTWMNVRSFPPEKFQTVYDEEIRQRAKWYYCPQALSEYKIPFLDIAYRQNLLDRMAPRQDLDGGYASVLFSGAQPSSVEFSEQTAFRHYLHCLHQQTAFAGQPTFDETVSWQETTLNTAQDLLSILAAGGVRGQQRDFSELIDVNRAALAVLQSTRGPMLRRRWQEL